MSAPFVKQKMLHSGLASIAILVFGYLLHLVFQDILSVPINHYIISPMGHGFDWVMEKYVLRTERRMWIWVHHKAGHPNKNALHCEVGGCKIVTPQRR